jgi:magnesium chelatase subunit I
VKAEIAENLLAMLRAGVDPWPGVIGFSDTVIPQLERALLAGHDVVLAGKRGQGKTCLLRALVGLLDEWTPVITGSELAEHPFDPITVLSRRGVAEQDDDLQVGWLHRSERYLEKLATRDVSAGDLLGDTDPVKVAKGWELGNPETIHFGLVSRAHRGILVVNELPNLDERIQAELLAVLEKRDIQVRGYTLRLPLDLLVVATANSDDYAHRGRIITSLKDRFGAEIHTHYPLDVATEVKIIRQNARLVAEVGEPLFEILARFARNLRGSELIDQRSGVSVRFTITAAETVAAAALRRSALTGEEPAVARPVDLEAALPASVGKLEFEREEEADPELVRNLLHLAITETAKERFAGLDLRPLADAVSDGHLVPTGERVPGKDILAALPDIAIVHEIALRGGVTVHDSPGQLASAVELALESLYLARRLAKESKGSLSVYGP